VEAVFEGRQVQKAQDTGNFIRIAGVIGIITLISIIVAASFIRHNRYNLGAAMQDWGERQTA
jgi:hypothetical protein